MLAQILPGLRDLRTPLAAGYVWLALLAVAFSEQLSSLVDELSSRFESIAGLDTVGRFALWGIITFIAYLNGIALVGLRKAIEEALSGLRSAPEHRPLQDHSDVFYNAATTDLSDRFLSDENFRDELVNLLDRDSVYTCILGELGRGDAQVALIGGTLWKIPEDLIALADLEDVDEVRRVAGHLVSAARYNSRLRNAILNQVIDLRFRVTGMYGELETAPDKLLVTSVPAFERWDRLRGEAEFRAGLVIPFLVLPAAVWSLGKDSTFGLENPQPSVLWLGAFFAPSLLLHWLAREKSREADKQLVGAWLAGVIDRPSTKGIKDEQLLFARRGSKINVAPFSERAQAWQEARAEIREKERLDRDAEIRSQILVARSLEQRKDDAEIVEDVASKIMGKNLTVPERWLWVLFSALGVSLPADFIERDNIRSEIRSVLKDLDTEMPDTVDGTEHEMHNESGPGAP